jgi:hypothetical protein
MTLGPEWDAKTERLRNAGFTAEADARDRYAAVTARACPYCGALAGESCRRVYDSEPRGVTHAERKVSQS